MTSTPKNPTKTAHQRHTPTFSFNNGPDNAVIMIGAIKTITMMFTNGRSASAAKKVYEDNDIRHVLVSCQEPDIVRKAQEIAEERSDAGSPETPLVLRSREPSPYRQRVSRSDSEISVSSTESVIKVLLNLIVRDFCTSSLEFFIKVLMFLCDISV